MPTTRVGVQAVTGSAGQVVDIDPARISAIITNSGSVAVEYSINSGSSWASIAASGTASFGTINTNELRLRRGVAGGYPTPVDINWTAQSEGEANSLTASQAASVSGGGIFTLGLVGDSLMARNHTVTSISGQQPTYNSSTGLMTFTQTSHGFYTGMPCRVSSSSGDLFRDLTLTRIDANTWSVNVGPGKTIISTTTNWHIAAECSFNAEGEFTHLRPSRPRLYNCGIPGATAAVIRQYSLPQAVALNPSTIWFRAGSNDVITNDLDATYTQIELAVRQLEATGVRLIISTIPPFGTSAANGAFTANLAAKIRNLQKTVRNSDLLDEHSLGVDPASANGSAAAGMLVADNTHKTQKFSMLCAARLQAILDARYGPASSPCPASAIDCYDVTNNPSNLQPFPNPTLRTATGGTAGAGTTGTVASGLTTFATGAATPVASVVAAGNGIGNAQQLVGTPAANNDMMRCTTRASESTVAALLVPGRRYKAVCHVKVSGLTGQSVLQSYEMRAVFTNAEGTFAKINDASWGNSNTAAQIPQVDFEKDFETPEFVCPSGITSAYIDPQIKFAAAGGSAVTVQVSQYAFVPV